MITVNKRLIVILTAIACLLLVLFIAMQFTNEVKWAGSDFIVMGALLLSAGLACELVLRKVKHRVIICAAVLVAFLLVWAEFAVGIFGTPFAGS